MLSQGTKNELTPSINPVCLTSCMQPASLRVYVTAKVASTLSATLSGQVLLCTPLRQHWMTPLAQTPVQDAFISQEEATTAPNVQRSGL